MGDNLIAFIYTNWRGEKALRHATPRQVVFKATEHHPTPQWIMVAWDRDKDAVRDFALKDCDFTVCQTCHGQRWVCEWHTDKPWNKTDYGCQCGAGAPCPDCNATPGVEPENPPGFMPLAEMDRFNG